MKKYTSVYFLHIPKTGGTYFRNNILNSIDTLINCNAHFDGHDGWNNKINDSTYVVSIFRNPESYYTSFFNYFYLKNKIIENNKDVKKEFLNFIEEESNQNIQSKFIINSEKINMTHFKDYSEKINIEKLNERLNRVNYIIDNQILRNDPEKIMSKICLDLNLPNIEFKNLYKPYKDKNSFNLYESLTDSEKNKILEINNLDFQIYGQLKSNSFKII